MVILYHKRERDASPFREDWRKWRIATLVRYTRLANRPLGHNMLQEFDLNSTSTIVTQPLPRPEGYAQCSKPRREITLQLTHRETGQSASARFSRNLTSEELRNWLENTVLKKFPASQAADVLRSRLNRAPVVLVPGWDESLGEAVHTALRKLCDSPATSYWWNLLHALPSELRAALYRNSVAALRLAGGTGKPVFLAGLASALAKSWTATLETAQDYFTPRPFLTKTEVAALGQAGWPDRAQLTLAQLENLRAQSFMASLAVRWLDRNDWAAMLGYLTKPVEVPSASAPHVVPKTSISAQGTTQASA